MTHTNQFTPGPWKAMRMENGAFSINMAESDNYMSLSVAGCYGNYEQNEANAKLIASAPELLEALKECIKVYEEHRDATPTGHLWPDPNHIVHAKQAINKAI